MTWYVVTDLPLHHIQERRLSTHVRHGYHGLGWAQPVLVLAVDEDTALSILVAAHRMARSVRLCASADQAQTLALSVSTTGDWGE